MGRLMEPGGFTKELVGVVLVVLAGGVILAGGVVLAGGVELFCGTVPLVGVVELGVVLLPVVFALEFEGISLQTVLFCCS